MPPQFVSLGPFTLNIYTFLIALAALASLAWAWFRARDVGIFTVALLLALGALVGGRAVYVALHWDYFHEHAHAGRLLRVTHHASPITRPTLNLQFSIFNSQFSILHSPRHRRFDRLHPQRLRLWPRGVLAD